MKFAITLHFTHFTSSVKPGDVDGWKALVKETLESIPGVHKAEVEPEGRKGIGEQ